MPALYALILIVAALHVIGAALLALLLLNRRSAPRRTIDVFAVIGLSFVLGVFAVGSVGTLLLLAGRFDLAETALYVTTAAAAATIVVLWRTKLLPRVDVTKRDLIVLVVLAALFVPLLLAPAYTHPIAWDAVVMWLAKAKSFFYESGLHNQLFTGPYPGTHNDYPLGASVVLATLFRLIGRTDDSAATVLLACALPAFTTLVVSAVRTAARTATRTPVVIPLLVVLALVPTGVVLEQYANGYVDTVLSAAITGTVLMFGYAVMRRDRRWLLVGLVSALATANIKNEGLVFFAVALLAALAYTLLYDRAETVRSVRANFRRWLGPVVAFAALAVPLTAWQIVKTVSRFPNDLAGGPPQNDLGFFMERLAKIGSTFAAEVVLNMHWLWTLAVLVVVFVALMIAVAWSRTHRRLLLPGLLVVTQAAVYLLVYLRTPHDLHWHLSTSIDRLLLHLVPAAVICAALWLGSLRTKENGAPGATR